MASSGRKGKKSKGKTVPLNDFLQDTPGPTAIIPVRSSSNWADEVEDSYDSYESRSSSKHTNVVLPTAPKAARGLEDIGDKIPTSPPFMAYLSNLPYDVEEDEIADFFCDLKISNMRIPKEVRPEEGTRVKGFGYVEFEDQESLVEALSKTVCTLKGRRIRIEVATSSDTDRRRGGRMDMNRDRPERPEVSMGDWRSNSGRKEPEPERRSYRDGGGFNRSENQGGGGGFNRSENQGGGGFNRSENQGSSAWRDGNDRPSYRDSAPITRDGGYRESAPMTREGGSYRDNGPREGGSYRDNGPRDGGSYRDNGSRDGGSGRGFGPRRYDDRNERRDDDRPSDRESRIRPKLNLAPRTKPIENPLPPPPEKEQEPEPMPRPAPVPAASIFGSAKPVDTSARERQIEERLAKQVGDGQEKDDRRRDDYRGRRSPDGGRRYSPDRRRDSSRGSPDRNRGGQRKDDRRAPPPRSDKSEKKPARSGEYTEKDMPKLKTPEPVNIVAKNQYSYLSEGSEESED